MLALRRGGGMLVGIVMCDVFGELSYLGEGRGNTYWWAPFAQHRLKQQKEKQIQENSCQVNNQESSTKNKKKRRNREDRCITEG